MDKNVTKDAKKDILGKKLKGIMINSTITIKLKFPFMNKLTDKN